MLAVVLLGGSIRELALLGRDPKTVSRLMAMVWVCGQSVEGYSAAEKDVEVPRLCCVEHPGFGGDPSAWHRPVGLLMFSTD
jgi:hypothetical protein